MKKQNLIIAVALTALALPASFAVAGEQVEASALHPIADADFLGNTMVGSSGTVECTASVDLSFDPILDADLVDGESARAAKSTAGQADLSFDRIGDVDNL